MLSFQKVQQGLVMGLAAAFLWACAPEAEEVAEPVRPIAWLKVSSQSYEQVRRISGILQAVESAQIGFEVAGRVDTVLVKVGERVTKGQILAELDEASYTLNTQASQGQLQEARAVLVEAENEYTRQTELFQNGWVSQAALDNAQAALERARSNVDIAQAQLNLSTKDLQDTALRAPYDGVITERRVEPSQLVAAAEPIIEIEGFQGLEISLLAPETIIDALSFGQVFPAHFPALPDLGMTAEITEIGSQAEFANAFPVTLKLTTDITALRAGMSAEVDFSVQQRGLTGYKGDVIAIPPTAIVPGGGAEEFVFVFDEETGSVTKRQVLTENILGNEILVRSGIEEGEIIAVSGATFLHDGQRVRLLGVGPAVYN